MEKFQTQPPKTAAIGLNAITQQARRAFGIGIAAIVAALLITIHISYLIFRYNYWQMYYAIGVVIILMAISFIAVLLSRKGRSAVSGWLIILGIFLVTTVFSLLIRNIGGGVGIIGLFVILFVSIQTLQQRQVAWATFLGVLALVFTRLVEVFPFLETASDVSLERVVQGATVLAIIVLGFLILRQFSSLSLTNKLLLIFLMVSIIVTYSTNYFNQNRTSVVLTNNAGTSLSNLAANQAQAIGDVLASELDSLTSLSLGSFMQNQVKAANALYPSDQGEILRILGDNDRLWKDAVANSRVSDPLLLQRLENDIAIELKQFATIFPLNYDMTLTDVNGGLLAAMSLTSSYYQGIQFWWQTTYSNGEGKVYVSPPIYDTRLKQNVVVISIPVRDRSTGKVIGILRTTYALTGIEEMAVNIRLGETGKANIYFPSNPTQLIQNGQLLLADDKFLEQLSMFEGSPYGEISLDNKVSYVSQAMIKPATPNALVENLGWWLAIRQDKAELLAPVAQQTRQAGFLSSIIVGVVSSLAILLSQFLSGPIVRLTETAEKIRGGDNFARAIVESDDEVGNLAYSFNSMTDQLRGILHELEQRVAERTRELTLAGEVGRALSRERDLDRLLNVAVNMIQESFELYYTQIYLTDSARRVLILRSGYGEVGAELIRRAHRLPIGAGSINGLAAFEKNPIIVTDTNTSPTFRANPLLPNTRSEMAVPLLVGDQLVGVLNMQSERAGTFSREVLPAYEALAGQLAVAVENAALIEQAQIAQQEMETQARRLTREGWQDFLDAIQRKEHMGYMYDQEGVTPLDVSTRPLPSDNAMELPIKVIGEQVGIIQLEKESQLTWSQDDIQMANSVVSQVANQIDSLRLLAQAEQYRQEAELAARKLTREGWSNYLTSSNEPEIGFVYDRRQVTPVTQEEASNYKPEMVQPIQIRGEELGELSLTGVHTMDEKSMELISAVAERLAEHIENLRLSAQTQSALMETEALYSIIERLNSASSYDAILNTLMENTLLKGADQLSIMGIFDKPLGETQIPEWIFPVAYKSKDEIEIAQRYPFNAFESIPNTLFTAQPAILADLNSDHRLDRVTRTLFKDVFNSQSSIIVPLALGSRIIGFIQGYFSEAAEFQEQEVQRLVAVSGQVAITVESLILLEQAQARAKQEQRIREVTSHVFGAADVDAILQKAAEQVGRTLGAPAYIYLGQNQPSQEKS